MRAEQAFAIPDGFFPARGWKLAATGAKYRSNFIP
jgi:hypothetical protein